MGIMDGSDRNIVIHIGANVAAFQAGIAAVRSEVAGLQSTMLGTLNGVASSLDRIGNAGILTGAAMTGLSHYITRAFGDALPMIMEFEKEQAKVTSLFTQSGEAAESVEKKIWGMAKALSESTTFTATEVTKGMYIMGQAGYDLQETSSSIVHFMKLAAAQGVDLGQTIEDVVGIMRAYDIEATEAWRITNLLAGAATASRVSMEDFHFGLKYVTPIFSELGYSIETTITALTQLTDLGYKGENAGRILRDAFTDLMNPTAEAMEILNRHNIAIYTNQEEMDRLTATYVEAADTYDMFVGKQKEMTLAMRDQRNVTEQLNLDLQRINLDMQKVRFKYGADDPYLKQLENEKDALDEAKDSANDYYDILKEEQKRRQNDITLQRTVISEIRRQINEVNSQMAFNRAQGYKNDTPVQIDLAKQKKELQDELSLEQKRLSTLRTEYNTGKGALDTQKKVITDINNEISDHNDKIKDQKEKNKEAEESELRILESKKIQIEEEKLAQAEKYQKMQDAQDKLNRSVDEYNKKMMSAKDALNDFVPEALLPYEQIIKNIHDANLTIPELAMIFQKQSAAGMAKLTSDKGMEMYGSRLAQITAFEGSGQYDELGNALGTPGEADRQFKEIMESDYGQWISNVHEWENTNIQAFQNVEDKFTETMNTVLDESTIKAVTDAKTSVAEGAINALESMAPWLKDAVNSFNNLDDSTKRAIGSWVAMGGAIMFLTGPLMLIGGIASKILGGIIGGVTTALSYLGILKSATVEENISKFLTEKYGGQLSKDDIDAITYKYKDKTLEDRLKHDADIIIAGKGGTVGKSNVAKTVASSADDVALAAAIAAGAAEPRETHLVGDKSGKSKYYNKYLSTVVTDFELIGKKAPVAATGIENVGTKTGLLASVAARLGPLLGMGGAGVAGGLATTGTSAVVANTGILGMLTSMTGMSGLAATLTPTLGVTGGAIAALAIPIALIVGAIGLLYFAWKNNWLGIQDTFKGVYDGLVERFGWMVDWFYEVKGEFEKTFGTLVDSLGQIWDGLVNADLTTLTEGLGRFGGTILRFFGQILWYAGDFIGKFGISLINGIIEDGPDILMAFVAFLADIPSILVSAGQVLSLHAAQFGANLIRSFLGIEVSEAEKRAEMDRMANALDIIWRGIGTKSNLADYVTIENQKRDMRRQEDAARKVAEQQKKNKESVDDLNKTVAEGIKSGKTNSEILKDLGISTDGVSTSADNLKLSMDNFSKLQINDYSDMFDKMDTTGIKTDDIKERVGLLNQTAAEPMLAPNYDQTRFDAFNANIRNSILLLTQMQSMSGNDVNITPYSAPVPEPVPEPVPAPAPAPTPAPEPYVPSVPASNNPVSTASPIGGSMTKTAYDMQKEYDETFKPEVTDQYKSGQSLVETFAQGVASAIGIINKPMGWLIGKVVDVLPHSPAKEGPLRELPVMGAEITQQVADGIGSNVGAITVAMDAVVSEITDKPQVVKQYNEEFKSLTTQYNNQTEAGLANLQQTVNQVNEAASGYVTAPDGTKIKLQAPVPRYPNQPLIAYKEKVQQPLSNKSWYYETHGATPGGVHNEQIANLVLNVEGGANKQELNRFGNQLLRKVQRGRGVFPSM